MESLSDHGSGLSTMQAGLVLRKLTFREIFTSCAAIVLLVLEGRWAWRQRSG